MASVGAGLRVLLVPLVADDEAVVSPSEDARLGIGEPPVESGAMAYLLGVAFLADPLKPFVEVTEVLGVSFVTPISVIIPLGRNPPVYDPSLPIDV